MENIEHTKKRKNALQILRIALHGYISISISTDLIISCHSFLFVLDLLNWPMM